MELGGGPYTSSYLTLILVPEEPAEGDNTVLNSEYPTFGEAFSDPIYSAMTPEDLALYPTSPYNLADYQQTNPAPPAPSIALPPAAPPQQPTDPGAVSESVDIGKTTDVTSAVLAAATPGLPGDVLTITGVSVTATLGAVGLVNGDLIYTASAAAFASLAANSTAQDGVFYTLSDQ